MSHGLQALAHVRVINLLFSDALLFQHVQGVRKLGVAFGFFSTRTGETVTACTLPVPNACDGFAESFQLRLFSIQCVLGATVPVTSRIQAFVAYRLVQPFTYGLGEINFVSGMQVAVR